MQGMDADAGSMVLQDEQGNNLIGVFSIEFPQNGPSTTGGTPAPFYPGPGGRTEQDITKDMKWHGTNL